MPAKKRANLNSSTERYVDFLRTLSLVGLGLETLSTDLHRVLLSEVEGEEAKVNTNISSSFQIAYADETSFIVAAGFQIVQRIENATSEDKNFLDLSCLFTALFNCAPATEAHRERFRDNEVRMIFWPYLRNLASDVANRMAIPAILLPLLMSTELPSTVGEAGHSSTKNSGRASI